MYSITHPPIDRWSINFASISRKINSIDGNPQKWNCKSVAFRLPRSRIQIMNWYHFLLSCFAWLVSIKPHRPISHWWFQTDSWWLTLLFDYLTIGCKNRTYEGTYLVIIDVLTSLAATTAMSNVEMGGFVVNEWHQDPIPVLK